jgi:5-methylcytosine-specific restriction endonuclease McrA
VLGPLEIEHIIPKAAAGTDNEENLWLACRLCNNFKGIQTHAKDPLTNRKTKLFNPRRQKWSRHFTWSDDGAYIIGITAFGRASVQKLFNNFG